MLVATALVLPLGFREAGPGLLEPSILASALAVGVFSSALPLFAGNGGAHAPAGQDLRAR